MSLLDALRYRLLPPLMVVVFTAATQALVSLGNPHRWVIGAFTQPLLLKKDSNFDI